MKRWWRRPPSPKATTLAESPTRTCVGCRRTAPQTELVRLALRDGCVVVDRYAAGRGAWLCNESVRCLDAAIKRNAFDRAWRTRVRPEMYAGLRHVFEAAPRNVAD